MRILLVEDDHNLAQALSAVLSKHNYILDVSTDGEMGWEMMNIISYDLVLLDIILPKLDGISLCRRLREHNLQVPVMLITAKDSLTDKLMGLDSGADDYLIKPFDIQELLARIRVFSRRLTEQSTIIFSCGDIRLNPEMRQITYQGQVIPFSRKEYLLIELFIRHPCRVFSRMDIVDHLWSLDKLPTEDTVKSHIRRIRNKLKAVGAEDLIETLYGHGYRINPSFLQDSSSRSPLSAEPGKELENAIAQIWQNIREGVFNHLKTLEQAVTSLQSQILDQNQLQTAQKSAHQLAGTVATFGFEAAAYIAKAIEILLQNQAIHLKTTHSLTQLVKTLRLELEQQPINSIHEENSLIQLNSSQDFPFDTQPIRIMAVDDDAIILILVKQILENEGIQVTTLEKPTQIWETLENVQPNLLILDINMPEMNGLEICQLIRETAQWSWLPILILTVQTDRQTVQQVFACGADDYLAKPIVPEELSTQVCNRIRRSQRLKQ
ncbi:Protein RcaC [Planktothrix tepida]|uniref:Two component transcriptional regulator, winged helix family n=2 Tax=Planktothrix TaxID=54304 RepID=A0A1J1LKX7_9CYAN|nr:MULTISPECIES: response regulator [Planktothrix]CAD5914063.1 Protein RcaC [Planktothrix pseudagardhii]CAD5983667.1 Protein RcaC [Planktothrix tepida]CUR32265.1 Two component transcriptional regulator, winged helix family [Planktothrix tepida PCC 9214]